jgi:hypothetical protein
MATKNPGRDYPLSATPAFKPVSDSTPVEKKYMTAKEFKQEKKQAKRENIISLAKEGNLGAYRAKKAKDVIGVVKEAVTTAAAAKQLLTPPSASRIPSMPDEGYRKKK